MDGRMAQHGPCGGLEWDSRTGSTLGSGRRGDWAPWAWSVHSPSKEWKPLVKREAGHVLAVRERTLCRGPSTPRKPSCGTLQGPRLSWLDSSRRSPDCQLCLQAPASISSQSPAQPQERYGAEHPASRREVIPEKPGHGHHLLSCAGSHSSECLIKRCFRTWGKGRWCCSSSMNSARLAGTPSQVVLRGPRGGWPAGRACC